MSGWHKTTAFAGTPPQDVFRSIASIVADRCGLSVEDLHSKTQRRDVSRARKLVALGCRYHGLTLAEIGRYLGRTRQAVSIQCMTLKATEADRRILDEVEAL